MPDSFIQVAPDSTGSKLRTRSRTVGANTVDEPYAIVLPHERNVLNRSWYSSLRIPIPASTTATTFFTIWYTGSNIINVRRLGIEVGTAIAYAALSPIARLYRITGTPPAVGSGSTLAAIQQDTTDAAITGTTVLAAHTSAEAYGALTVTGQTLGALAWQQVLPRFHTLTGFAPPTVLNMLPDDGTMNQEDPLVIRNGAGIALRWEFPTTGTVPTASTWHVMVKAVVTEYTVP